MWTTPELPYQNLPPLPPASSVETPRVLKAVISASRHLSALDAACRRLPDPTILINTIPLLEAQASSEIENIVTTNDEVFRAAHSALPGAGTPAVKEALRYRQALRVGAESLLDRPLHTNTAVDICSILQGHTASIRATPGTYIGNPATKQVIYTPPTGRDVIEGHLALWERFLHEDHGIDPLVSMALQHYQFEAIHPFADGNGRTGRILNLLYLVHKDLLQEPVLYLSGYIVRHKDEYYRLLRAVTEVDDWESWILFMVDGCGTMASWTLSLIEEIASLQRETEQLIKDAVPRAPAAELARLLFTKPYVRIEDIVSAGFAKRAAASRWLTELARTGFLTREQIGKSLLFVNKPLLRILFTSPLAP